MYLMLYMPFGFKQCIHIFFLIRAQTNLHLKKKQQKLPLLSFTVVKSLVWDMICGIKTYQPQLCVSHFPMSCMPYALWTR